MKGEGRLQGPGCEFRNCHFGTGRPAHTAARFWPEKSPDRKIEFDFQIARPGEEASIEVPVTLEDERRPYNVQWSMKWDWHVVAHEMGHVMGLNDEHNQLRSTLNLGDNNLQRRECNPDNLMCDAWSPGAKPRPYHY